MATSSGARCRGGGGRGLCWRGGGLRKYVFLCAACGGMSSLLGILFLAVYFMLRSYTSSLVYFETVPTYVPASMLLSTGLVVMCLARRRNRYSFLMKLCGCACLASAALCVLVTVATTVVHMSRLQSLSQCHYQQRTQTCTCYSALIDASATDSSDEGARYVFNAIPDCDVIHGALYSCLRAMFGLSVVGILVCIFSGMLVYQLFSHEKKKMYWEQLERRCRYLYRRQQSAQQALQQHVTHHCGSCSCCEDCRDLQTPPPSVPWEFMDNRYWAPGRVGNLYSPNPEDHAAPALRGAPRGGAAPNPGSGSAWSWRRLPWGRSTAVGGGSRVAGEVLCIRPQNAASPDSQYGFSGSECGRGLSQLGAHLGSHLGRDPTVGPYLLSQVYPAPQPHPRPFAPVPPADSMGMPLPLAVPMPLSLADDLGPQFYLWGPPPPYMSNPASAANSPARRDPGVSPSPASPGCNLTNNYQQLLRANQRPTHRCGVGSATPAGPAGPVGPTTMAPDTLDRPLSPGEDPGNNSVDSLSSPEKTVPRKKRRKAAADGSADPSLEAEAPRPELDSPESPTPTAQAALPGPTAARKAKKRSDAPAPPGSRPNSRPSSRHSSRYSHRARAHGDTCCGDASDDVDTEGYSYPRLRFPPPQPPTTPPSSPPTSDSQAILAAFDNQAFQEAASDCPGSPGGVPLQGPVKTLTLGPQGPLVCKKRSADPNESEVYFGDDSSCCNVSEQHSSLTYEDPGRELRAFKLVHSHVQQRSMDSTPTRPVSVHRPSASTLSDSAVPDPASRLPPYHLHPIETTVRQRMPLPLPANSPDRLSLAPDAQYESIADSNVYTYISPLPLVHQVARTVSRTTSSPLGSPSGSSAPPQARRKAACDSPHKAVESADDKENATNTQREATETAAARAGAGPVSAPSPSQRPLCPPDERPGIDV